MKTYTSSSQHGIDCPECKSRIVITMEALLNQEVFYCVSCGLKLLLDRDASAPALDQARQMHEDQEYARAIGQKYRQ